MRERLARRAAGRLGGRRGVRRAERPAPDAPRRWIVDPIDGTKSYVRGVPVWATLLALEVDGELTVGVVSAPALGRRWWAARGAGRVRARRARTGAAPAARLGRPGARRRPAVPRRARGLARGRAARRAARAERALLAHAGLRRLLAVHAGRRGRGRDRARPGGVAVGSGGAAWWSCRRRAAGSPTWAAWPPPTAATRSPPTGLLHDAALGLVARQRSSAGLSGSEGAYSCDGAAVRDRRRRRARGGDPAPRRAAGADVPLATRMRPQTLDELVGQEHLLAAGSALRRAIEEGHPHSMILHGPPGSGKTTLARLVAAGLGRGVRGGERRAGRARRGAGGDRARPASGCSAAAGGRCSSSTRSTASTRPSRTRCCRRSRTG